VAEHPPAGTAGPIAALLGADRVREPAGLEAAAARVIAEPATVEELCELARACERDNAACAPLGAARTLAQIRREPVAVGVSLRRLARVVAYEPADMTVVAEAGMTVADLNRALATARQRLPVDPRDPEAATVGALVAAHHAGPLRLSEGTVRDLLIGIRFIGHGGKVIRGGGRVVKNVAGYDLMKVMCGSFGTLGIIIEATFKVRPVPEHYALARAEFDGPRDAFDAAAAVHAALPVAHLEVLSPAPAAATFGRVARFVLAAGMSGSRAEIMHQRARLATLLTRPVEFIEGDDAARSYQLLRDLELAPAALTAQIAVPPAELARCLEACGAAEFRAHAGSGVAQMIPRGALSAASAQLMLKQWREVAHSARGYVRVLRVEAQLRGGIEMFDLPRAGALALMRRLKSAFDPAGVFNPRCFVGEI
jgi:glycolate dehydrogenase FAD-binding subunit